MVCPLTSLRSRFLLTLLDDDQRPGGGAVHHRDLDQHWGIETRSPRVVVWVCLT